MRTITLSALFNPKIAYLTTISTLFILLVNFSATNCQAQERYLEVSDTRNINDAPGDLKNKIKFDFKFRSVVGVPGTGTYSGMMTLAPWADDSGGKNHQINFNNGGIFYRTGSHSSPSWEGWRKLAIEDVNGNLGIAVDNPTAKLHINAPLDGPAIKIGIPGTPGNLHVPLHTSTGGYNIDFYTWRDAYTDQIGARIRAERINIFQENNALVQSMDLSFYTSNGMDAGSLSEKMRITSGGSVAIGLKDPKGFMLAVGGNMIAESIKVKPKETWPDYVFANQYQLPTLQQTEQYIKTEGHLKDMPSATEVKSKGIDLGEMNAKLLQKIEELTLYLIEQNKSISKLQVQNKHLISEIEKIKIKL